MVSSQASATPEVRGKVVSASGAPLADVIVLSMPTAEGKTDSLGEFLLKQPSRLVRFSLAGFRPVTKLSEELQKKPTVVLEADPNAAWDPPRCPTNQSGRVMYGDNMQFTLGPGVEMRRGQDIDYQMNVVCIGKSCMQHGFGPLWSFGMPPWRDFPDGFDDLKERDVKWRPDLNLQGSEYRSAHANGTYTRWVGIFGESVSYDHASKDASEGFDKVIDSLCWRKR